MAIETSAEPAVEVDQRAEQDVRRTWIIYLLFLGSGIPALIYEIVWQRALFALYGINIESVTIVVSAFMLGLGLGSLGGGILSRSRLISPVALFAAAEFGTAIFGLVSLSIFRYVAEYTLARPLWTTALISFLLVVVPTVLMGSTLPLLVEQLVRSSHNVGGSVGALYFVNTLGSGVACIIVARPLMSYFGQAGSVQCAALMNALVGASALVYGFHSKRDAGEAEYVSKHGSEPMDSRLVPFTLALFCATLCGLAALSYEIIWYRLLAFASRDTAPAFASLLGSYLVGLALGSRFAEGYAERHPAEPTIPVLGTIILGSAIVGFWVSPASALALKIISPESVSGRWSASLVFLILICHAAILFGAIFPLIAHVAVGPKRVGSAVSRLYAANIAGSTLGVLLVGFILMDRFSLYRISLVLLIGGVLCAAAVFRLSARLPRGRKPAFALACTAAVFIAPISRPVFRTIYDRLLFKSLYPAIHFQEVLESRSGTIGVTPDG
ncbi:MAG TPA: hypothetical protein VGV15_23325, partial [Terriglobales bacterium]|nr:hypothetical protein [Terriglobales bacterium]